jgi:hypothetical protein
MKVMLTDEKGLQVFDNAGKEVVNVSMTAHDEEPIVECNGKFFIMNSPDLKRDDWVDSPLPEDGVLLNNNRQYNPVKELQEVYAMLRADLENTNGSEDRARLFSVLTDVADKIALRKADNLATNSGWIPETLLDS